jgi:RNA polymerase sigma-70 factor (ECF subfamily)
MAERPSSPEELLAAYGSLIYAAAYRACGRHELAEEATAAAVYAAWSKLSSFDGKSALTTWLTRIAVNAAIDAVRKERAQTAPRSAPLAEALDLADEHPAAAPSAALEAEARERRVHEALAALDERHREVLILREWEGLSYKEIAAALGCPIGTVMSRLSHARRLFQERYEPEGT